jgi:hypothetical protein
MRHVGNNGIYVYDRGGDRINLFGPLFDREARFLVRLVGNRDLVYNRQTLLANELARSCPCPFRKVIVKLEGEKEVCYELRLGHRKVYLPGLPARFTCPADQDRCTYWSFTGLARSPSCC